MLSELPKLADKAFVLGFFLPTVLFALGAAELFTINPGRERCWRPHRKKMVGIRWSILF